MVTTFERLAKVLKGYIKPANWIERAFASVASALVPSYTAEDEGKVLGVTKVEDGYDETVIVQEQTLTLNGSKKAPLETDSYDFSSLSDGDSVTVLVTSNGETTEIECTYTLTDISAEGVFALTCGSRPTITYTAGTANATYTFKAVTRETKYKAESAWVESGSGALVVDVTYDGSTDTLNKTWKEIKDASKNVPVIINEIDAGSRDLSYIFYLTQIGYSEIDSAYFVQFTNDVMYTTDSENSYPAYSNE